MTVHAIHIKTKLCQLVEAMMKRRDDLAFRQEMKFRNKLVEYLTDWVMGTSHQIAPPSSGDVTMLTRDLDQACMEAVAALLRGLPLQPEESDRGDLMEAKSQLFLKYFTLFMNLLNDCSDVTNEEKDTTRQRVVAGKLNTLRNATIQAMSNLLSANIDSGLMHSIDLGYNRDLQTRAAFMEVAYGALRNFPFDIAFLRRCSRRFCSRERNSIPWPKPSWPTGSSSWCS